MTDVAYVYALVDPRDGEIRYVGQAVDPEKRFNQHRSSSREKTHKSNWIKKLKSLGLKPTLQILEECPTEDVNWTEMWWIAYYKVLGYKLTNSTNGGEGTRGYVPSAEHKAKMSAWQSVALITPTLNLQKIRCEKLNTEYWREKSK